ncbi:MAG TPA: ABC transporter substrate-binding protein [Ktedonobacteraceae bacterium]|nr:ABC transporter substrate-binding protein [Ktedonobacteraceae bacterium]
MSRRTSFAAMMLALLLGIIVTACGGQTQSSTGTKITVWLPGNTQSEITYVTNTIVPAFEKANPGIQVDLQYVDWGNFSPKLNSAFAGGIAPDVFGYGTAATAGYVAANQVLPLNSYINGLSSSTRADFGNLFNQGKVGSNYYAVPFTGQGELFAYRTDLFQQAGLDPNKPPTNWEQLMQDAERLTQRSGNSVERAGLVVNESNPSLEQSFATFLEQAGGSLISSDGKSVTWNSPAGVKALQFMVNMYNGPHAVASNDNVDYGSLPAGQQPLLTGKAAIALVGQGQLLTMQEANPQVFKHIAVMPPLGEPDKASFGGVSYGLYINKASKNADAAWRFIQYMINPTTLNSFYQVNGSLPIRTSLVNSSFVKDHPYMKTFIQAYSTFQPNPNVAAWVNARDILIRYIEQALAQQSSPKAALDSAAAEVNPLLAK